jgi:hypothetical protein
VSIHKPGAGLDGGAAACSNRGMHAGGEDDFEVQLARCRALEPGFVGLDLAEARVLAENLGLQLRVIDTDDTALTADLRARRMTVDVRTGTVTSAKAG